MEKHGPSSPSHGPTFTVQTLAPSGAWADGAMSMEYVWGSARALLCRSYVMASLARCHDATMDLDCTSIESNS